MNAEPLPPRDPETLLPTRASAVVANLGVGALGGALGAFLMALEEGVEGHGHGGGGSPFLMLPHQVLLALPLTLLVVLLARESRPERAGIALASSLAGILLVDLLLA